MKKVRMSFIGLVAVLALGSSGIAFAAPCVNIVAVWVITCESAFIDLGGPVGFTPPITGTLDIMPQDGCLFRGSIAVGTTSGLLTGAIDGRDIRITTTDTVVDGRLIGSNQMELTVSVLAPTGTGVVNTSLCTAIRP